MLYAVFASLLAQRVEPGQPIDTYPFVTVPMAVTDRGLWDIPIQMCGHVVPSPHLGESLMFGGGQWMYVDTSANPALQVGSAACVTGVVRRRDGLSHEEAKARDLPSRRGSHSPDADQIFKLCADPESCLALVPKSAAATNRP